MCARQEHVLVILGTERKFGTKKRERKKKIGKDIYLPLRNNRKRKKEKDRERYLHRTLGDLKTPVPQPCEWGAPWPKAIHLTFCIAHDLLSSFGDATRVRKNVMEQKERITSCEKKPAVSRRK